MLTFFRRIRKGMLDSGAMSKYLLYAIGEIALVVIGILIALQINNWNEERKIQNQIEVYLYNLDQSIRTDLINFQEIASHSDFRFKSLHHLLNVLGHPAHEYDLSIMDRYNSLSRQVELTSQNDLWIGAFPDTLNEDFLTQCINQSVFVETEAINTDVFEEMKSIGIFSSIQDGELKNAINSYYNFFESRFVLADWNRGLTESWRPFLRDRFQVVANETHLLGDPSPILDDPQAIARIQEMVGPARWRASNAFSMIVQGQKINELLAAHLGLNSSQ